MAQDMSLLYIQPLDVNTTQLLLFKFNGTDYNNQKHSIVLSLSAKNKLGFVKVLETSLLLLLLCLMPGRDAMTWFTLGYRVIQMMLFLGV